MDTISQTGSDISVRQLHVRAARGEALTEAERASLEAWYAQQDAEEAALLDAAARRSGESLEHLRGEVDAALSRLTAVAQRIQALTEENEALRGEVAALHQELLQTAHRQAA